jgi:hypothetical protein
VVNGHGRRQRGRPPDFVVTDKASRGATGYGYRIELIVSGTEPYDLSFESSQPAVTLRVSDIDNDRDLDVQLSVPISEKRLAVWVNDTGANPLRLTQSK